MFNKKELSDAYQKAKETFDNFAYDIAHVSQDIKLLELILKNYAPKFSFQSLLAHELKNKPRTNPIKKETADYEHHLYEFVSWEISDRERKCPYRIFYKKYEAWLLPGSKNMSKEGAIEVKSAVPKQSKILEYRPLIETPVLIRLKIYPHLPAFLEELTQELLLHKSRLDFTKLDCGIKKFESKIKPHDTT